MDYRRHTLTNLRPDATFFQRLKAHILYYVGATIYTERRNFLTQEDYLASYPLLMPGDLILVANHRRLTGILLRGIVTHALIYAGEGKCIQANSDGVVSISYEDLFFEYDTLIIRRPARMSESEAQSAIAFCSKRIGLPYDFDFDPGDEFAWFCTDLVAYAYTEAGVDLGIDNPKGRRLFATDLLSGNFNDIFHSRSLSYKHRHFKLKHAIYNNFLMEYLLQD